MTIGSIVSDNRVIHSGTCGSAYIGERFARVWNGADRVEGEAVIDHPYLTTIASSYNPEITWRDVSAPTNLYTGSVQSCFGVGPFASLSWSDNDDLKLYNKAAKKIRGSDFNLGNFVGESHQTISLIANTATRIAKGLHYLRNGNFYKAAKEFGGPRIKHGHVLSQVVRKKGILLNATDYSDLILEYQYGWKPLLEDVHGSAHTLANRLNMPFKTRYKVSRALRVQEITTGEGGVKFNSATSRRVSLIVVLKTQPTLSTTLHLNDPLSVAWEVMPWSFIADWFLPIGDYLGGLDFFRSFDIDYIVRSDKEVKNTAFHSQGPNYIINGAESYYERNVQFSRFILSSPSDYRNLPTPSFKSMKEALTPTHLLNAFALLTSSTDGIRKSLKF